MQPVRIAEYFDILSQSRKVYSRQLEPVCRKWELSRSEVDVMLFLYNNPGYDRAADIVTRRGMTKSLVSMAVTSLTDRGLLERQLSPQDRRTAHLRLTEPGRSIAAEAKAAQEQFFATLYRGVSAEELDTWERITRRVHENIEELSKSL
jgi:MarR family transcriptional regulator for hemolysin